MPHRNKRATKEGIAQSLGCRQLGNCAPDIDIEKSGGTTLSKIHKWLANFLYIGPLNYGTGAVSLPIEEPVFMPENVQVGNLEGYAGGIEVGNIENADEIPLIERHPVVEEEEETIFEQNAGHTLNRGTHPTTGRGLTDEDMTSFINQSRRGPQSGLRYRGTERVPTSTWEEIPESEYIELDSRNPQLNRTEGEPATLETTLNTAENIVLDPRGGARQKIRSSTPKQRQPKKIKLNLRKASVTTVKNPLFSENPRVEIPETEVLLDENPLFKDTKDGIQVIYPTESTVRGSTLRSRVVPKVTHYVQNLSHIENIEMSDISLADPLLEDRIEDSRQERLAYWRKVFRTRGRAWTQRRDYEIGPVRVRLEPGKEYKLYLNKPNFGIKIPKQSMTVRRPPIVKLSKRKLQTKGAVLTTIVNPRRQSANPKPLQPSKQYPRVKNMHVVPELLEKCRKMWKCKTVKGKRKCKYVCTKLVYNLRPRRK